MSTSVSQLVNIFSNNNKSVSRNSSFHSNTRNGKSNSSVPTKLNLTLFGDTSDVNPGFIKETRNPVIEEITNAKCYDLSFHKMTLGDISDKRCEMSKENDEANKYFREGNYLSYDPVDNDNFDGTIYQYITDDRVAIPEQLTDSKETGDIKDKERKERTVGDGAECCKPLSDGMKFPIAAYCEALGSDGENVASDGDSSDTLTPDKGGVQEEEELLSLQYLANLRDSMAENFNVSSTTATNVENEGIECHSKNGVFHSEEDPNKSNNENDRIKLLPLADKNTDCTEPIHSSLMSGPKRNSKYFFKRTKSDAHQRSSYRGKNSGSGNLTRSKSFLHSNNRTDMAQLAIAQVDIIRRNYINSLNQINELGLSPPLGVGGFVDIGANVDVRSMNPVLQAEMVQRLRQQQYFQQQQLLIHQRQQLKSQQHLFEQVQLQRLQQLQKQQLLMKRDIFRRDSVKSTSNNVDKIENVDSEKRRLGQMKHGIKLGLVTQSYQNGKKEVEQKENPASDIKPSRKEKLSKKCDTPAKGENHIPKNISKNEQRPECQAVKTSANKPFLIKVNGIEDDCNKYTEDAEHEFNIISNRNIKPISPIKHYLPIIDARRKGIFLNPLKHKKIRKSMPNPIVRKKTRKSRNLTSGAKKNIKLYPKHGRKHSKHKFNLPRVQSGIIINDTQSELASSKLGSTPKRNGGYVTKNVITSPDIECLYLHPMDQIIEDKPKPEAPKQVSKGIGVKPRASKI